MQYQYTFHIVDVTCEKCEARLQETLRHLPGTQEVELVRTPQDEAQVHLASSQELLTAEIEQAVEDTSAGTTHHYRVRWSGTDA